MMPCSVRILVTANFVSTEIRDSLTVWFEQLGISAQLLFSSYDSVIQTLLDPDKAANQVDLTVVLLQIERWCNGASTSETSIAKRNLESFLDAVRAAASLSPVTNLLILSCPPSPQAVQDGRMQPLEHVLQKQLIGLPGVEVLTSNEINQNYPTENYTDYFCDDSFASLGIVYSQLGFATIGTVVARHLNKLFKPPRKVIVVDCDNTLWTGICAEVGPSQVVVGHGNQMLQEILVRQSKSGQLVCLCSKNSETDVFAVLDENPSMLLGRQHLSAHRINWHSKADNLQSLSEELNLNLDSFVFLDDDTFECESVRSLCPDVLTIQVPHNQSSLCRVLLNIWDFDCRPTTNEDIQRAMYYMQNAERDRDSKNLLTLDEFIKSLDLRVEISELQSGCVLRAAQLTQRANQFNLNGARLTAAQLNQLSITRQCFVVEAVDRYGDYGLIGVLVYYIFGTFLLVSHLVLSCRALGRGIEDRIGIYLLNVAQSSGVSEIKFDFLRTDKNTPLRLFLARLSDSDIDENAVVAVETLCSTLGELHA
jgi:FkbH-like protein